jgi:hypothetical protein
VRIYRIDKGAKEHWGWIRPYMVRAARFSEHKFPVAGHLQSVLSGNGFFLVCEDNDEVMGVCKVDITPKGLHVNALAGKNLKAWLQPIIDAVEVEAKALGKCSITSHSRPGIGKLLKAAGCKVQLWSMVRRVA